MEKIGYLVGVSVLVLVVFTSECLAGTEPVYTNHRSTSLEELKQIDGLVANNLPLFEHGFFVQTENGPVLVKQKEEGFPSANKPRLNPGYYSTLPRLIPAGYEGIATSHFNLGSAIPAQPPIIPVVQHQHQNHHIQPQSQTYQHQHQRQSSSPIQHQHQQYSNQHNIAPIQYTQHSTDHTPRGFEQQQSSQSQSQQFIHRGQRQRQRQRQLQHVPLPQQQFPQQELQQFQHEQLQQPQRQQRFLSQNQLQRQHSPVPVAQDTFQIDNFLNADDNVPISYQNQVMGQAAFSNDRFTKNRFVEETFAFEETLPDHLRNPFYKNRDLAAALAQESLPTEGEEVVGTWDTTKIQKQRIGDLLRAAGFI